jgi:superoxide reductase
MVGLIKNGGSQLVCCDKENAEVYAYCNLHGLWKTEVK